ncbi:hypothetical protein [Ureibacillus sinduriensis]|uniref:Membrane protein n=1 Tax=Ureibacillus sinduriensis BLB-1 = JCM 15800 TaxID=1384057 RepID=A0A0A3IL84_9BACL|nr:hypothetical protein [Ureibacillus sinduriensis]KGR75592.1 membrane protein [Ureibacillus sinduriensis BLB-1 = JCM 15800]
MDLIDVYIYEVTRRLPIKNREDIGLELKSTIEDMLPDGYTEEDVKVALGELGNPAILASGYNERPMHLIGPKYFDIYVSLLKMIVPIAAVISFIVVLTKYIVEFDKGDTVLNVGIVVLGEGIWSVIHVFMQVFFWLTLTFVILERTDQSKDKLPRTMSFNKWTPEDLENIPYVPKERMITKGYVFASLLWTSIWGTVYFNADHLVGVYKNSGGGLEFIMPAFNQHVMDSFGPVIIVVLGLEIVFALILFINNEWTKKLAILNTVRETVGLIVLAFLIVNPNFFHPEFLSYMSGNLEMPEGQIRNYVIGATLVLYAVSSIMNCISGFRKANR